MIGQIEKAYDSNRNLIEGEVLLVYQDALASGTNEYITITEILVRDGNSNVLKIKPRNIVKILPKNIGYWPDIYPHNSAGY